MFNDDLNSVFQSVKEAGGLENYIANINCKLTPEEQEAIDMIKSGNVDKIKQKVLALCTQRGYDMGSSYNIVKNNYSQYFG